MERCEENGGDLRNLQQIITLRSRAGQGKDELWVGQEQNGLTFWERQNKEPCLAWGSLTWLLSAAARKTQGLKVDTRLCSLMSIARGDQGYCRVIGIDWLRKPNVLVCLEQTWLMVLIFSKELQLRQMVRSPWSSLRAVTCGIALSKSFNFCDCLSQGAVLRPMPDVPRTVNKW